MTKTRVLIYVALVTLVISFILHSYLKVLTSLRVSPGFVVNKRIQNETADKGVQELLDYLKVPVNSKEDLSKLHEKFETPPANRKPSGESFVHEQERNQQRIVKVCAVATNKRQGSIFRTNLLHLYGSRNYTYVIRGPGDCPWNAPRIRMIPYVKCCMTTRHVRSIITRSIRVYDIIIITGDEYCRLDDPRSHFRQYHGDQMMGTGVEVDVPNLNRKVRFPLYIPLGPRSEFERVPDKMIVSSKARQYLFNFVGSLTSTSRRKLKAILVNNNKLQELEKNNRSFIHITDRWRTEITVQAGFISPKQYRRVLLNSKFTLCPIGHNPEAYRVYEACEAGSIPILTIGSPVYLNHKCRNSYAPWITSNAPFIYLKDWTQLSSVIEQSKNESWVMEKQGAVMAWYKDYMQNFTFTLERIMEWRYKKRISRARPSKTVEDEILKHELLEAENISKSDAN